MVEWVERLKIRLKETWDEWTDWEAWKQWATWDERIMDTFRDRVNFILPPAKNSTNPHQLENRFIKKRLSPKERTAEIKKHRSAILKAIKEDNPQGEHINRQTRAFIFGKICIGLITLSAGFLISAVLISFFPNIPSWASKVIATAAFLFTVKADTISFRKSVPRFFRLLFERDKSLGSHFFASQERQLDVSVDLEGKVTVTPQYHYEDDWDADGNSVFAGQATPRKAEALSPKWLVFLGVCFCLSVFVGLSILAQTVEKSPMGMHTILSLPIFVARPIAWIMALAAFFVMLGQYTYSVIRFVRNPDKLKEFKAIFRKFDTPENIVYNSVMIVLTIALSAVVAFGMYGTSDVQSTCFMKLAQDAQNSAAKIAVWACTIAGKSLFTFRATFNFLGILPQAVSGLGGWVREKCNNGWHHLTGRGELQDNSHSPFDHQNSEDQISTLGFVAITCHALAKSSTAIQLPDGGFSSAFQTANPLIFSENVVKAFGAASRTINEPLDKQTVKARVQKP